MIPVRKKTAEEIAALREGLGIPDELPEPGAPRQRTQYAAPLPPAPNPELPAPEACEIPPTATPILNPTPPEHLLPDAVSEAAVHLNITPVPVQPVRPEPKPIHTLRKHELPLAPAPAVTNKTAIPAHRHDPRDIVEIRKREAIAKLQQPGMDPAAHLRRQIASPFLYSPGYLLAIAAGAAIFLHVHHITPIVLLAIATLVMIFIAVRKPRSRHHAALLFILIFLTLVFGALHYAPLFSHGP
jgi:hypothetical protein